VARVGVAAVVVACVLVTAATAVGLARSGSDPVAGASSVVGPSGEVDDTTAGTPGAGRFATIVIGRSEWVAAAGCEPLEGAVALDRAALALAARGLRATGGVVPGPVDQTERTCDDGFAIRTSWNDLAALRDAGWAFVPRSSGPLEGLAADDQRAQTCGARDALVAQGHDRAWGLFAYANNARDVAVQRDLVATCFAFGRTYGNGVTVQERLASPWWQSTRSVNGGACQDEARPCAAVPGVRPDLRYDPPDELAATLRAAPGEWRTVQFYRFVEGARLVGDPAWDCTSADPRDHWTTRPELYCFVDFVAVLDALDPAVTVTDPATVAEAWGRRPG
jgi:hypothetical protein